MPPSPSVTGDYDGDDEYQGAQRSDGDNDDSTPKDRDNDADSSGRSYFDRDDRGVLGSGRAASAPEKTAISRLVERYFATASAGDGATACSLIASSFARSIVVDYGRPPGPIYSSGANCSTVLTKIFEHYHRQLTAHEPTLRVAAARIEGDEGVVVLAFARLPGRQVRVLHEGGAWRMNALLDRELE